MNHDPTQVHPDDTNRIAFMISLSKAFSTIHDFLSPSKMNPPNMQTYEARLASFEKAQAGSKRRNSNAKGGKGAKWPHKSPGAVDVSRFYTSVLLG